MFNKLRGLFSATTPLVLVISRKEVESGNIKPTLSTLQALLSSPQTIKDHIENVEINFSGYNNHCSELWEIIEVRTYVRMLDDQFPYWLYFLTKQGTGLHAILQCFLLPHLTPDAKAKHYGQQLNDYLLNRGFPAMNQLCDIAGFPEKKVESLTERVVKYIASAYTE